MMIGEGMIDLGPYYRKAYKRGITLKLFETKKGKFILCLCIKLSLIFCVSIYIVAK